MNIDRIERIDDEEAKEAARRVAREEGILVGISSGANLVATLRTAAALPPEAVVLTIFCDAGDRYLTTDLFESGGGL